MCVDNFLIRNFSSYVGKDQFGNEYYTSGAKRRVAYKGLKEPSKVPPMWHAWLHYLTNDIPHNEVSENYSWQKPYIPNLTGTKRAYKPTRDIVSSDYQPWKPS